MKKGIYLTVLFVLLAVAGGAAWFVSSHTIIRTDKEYVFAEKEKMNFENNYVDVRNWTVLDYLDHPAIAQALIKEGYQDIKAELEKSDIKTKVDESVQKAGDVLKSFADQLKK